MLLKKYAEIMTAMLFACLFVREAEAGKNLICNGDFEERDNERPVAWQFYPHVDKGRSTDFEGKIDRLAAKSGKNSVKIVIENMPAGTNGPGPAKAGYSSDEVMLYPNKVYVLSLWYKGKSEKGGGDSYLDVQCVPNQVTEWSKERPGRLVIYDMPGEWRKTEIKFCTTATNAFNARFNFTACLKGNGNETVWLDDVCLEERSDEAAPRMVVGGVVFNILTKSPNVESSETFRKISAEKGKDCLIFAPADPDGVYPGTEPREAEITNVIRIFATPGEYEPVTFAVYPFNNRKNVSIQMGDFSGPNGSVISNTCVNVSIVKTWVQVLAYKSRMARLVPEVLENKSSFDLEKGKTSQAWLSIHVPEKASPGKYESDVCLLADGKQLDLVKVELHVLPFALITPDDTRQMWFDVLFFHDYTNGPLSLLSYEKKRELVREQLRLLREMGINSIHCVASPSTLEYKKIKKDGDSITADLGAEDAIMQLCREAGVDKHVCFEMTRFAGTVCRFLGMSYKGIPSYGNLVFITEKTSNAAFEQVYKGYVKYLVEYAKNHNWPKLIFEPIDEPCGNEDKIQSFIYQSRLIKEAAPDATVYTSAYEPEPARRLQPWLDIRFCRWSDVCQGEAANRRFIEEVRSCHDLLWICHWLHHEEDLFRLNRGIAGWMYVHSNADGHMWWYCGFDYDCVKAGQWDDLYDLRQGIVNYGVMCNELLVPSPPDLMPVTTLRYEGIREGLDDVRYVTTLKRYIERALASGDSRIMEAGKHAQDVLNAILAELPWADDFRNKKFLYGNKQLNKYRWKIAEQIMALQQLLQRGE